MPLGHVSGLDNAQHLSLMAMVRALAPRWQLGPAASQPRLVFRWPRRSLLVVKMSSSDKAMVKTAKEAVDAGLSLFSKGRVKEALQQFEAALAMDPGFDEAQAAYYNKACCHAAREEPDKAAECLRTCLRDYNLKFSVILSDKDMVPFRATSQFRALQEEARKGGEDIGSSFRRDLKLISEVQAPFRAVRKFFYVAFFIGAGISTFLTLPRFFRALQGGEGAPSIAETGQNLAVNVVGLVALAALFIWDTRKEEAQLSRITRDETLSRLPIRLQTGRIVEVVQLRGTTRPIILAGSKEAISRAVQKAERFRKELLKRGALLVPLEWNKKDDSSRRKGFGRHISTTNREADGFQRRAEDVASRAVTEGEKRFAAEVVSQTEWESWVREQQEAEGVTPGEEVYIVLRLDGRVRKSGKGMPDWQELVNELPTLDAVMSKLER